MNRDLVRILFTLVAILGLVGIMVPVSESCHRKQGSVAEQISHEKKGEADGHAAEAGKADGKAAQRDPEIARLQAEVDRLMAERARPKRPALVPAPASPLPVPPVVDPGPEGAGGPLAGGLQADLAKAGELIDAQGRLIDALKLQVTDLTTARDHWKGAFQAERDRSLQLEIALEAQKAMTRGALWRGRIQGLTVGLGAGYVAGRVH